MALVAPVQRLFPPRLFDQHPPLVQLGLDRAELAQLDHQPPGQRSQAGHQSRVNSNDATHTSRLNNRVVADHGTIGVVPDLGAGSDPR